MEEDIKILERLKEEKYTRETVNSIYEYFDEETAPYVLTTIERQAIENLIVRNKELEGCNDRLFRIIEDSILKSKVRELQDKYKSKIEKLESKKIWNEPVDTINKNRYTNYYNAYEELLQEGDK